jgi:hypothetical protein
MGIFSLFSLEIISDLISNFHFLHYCKVTVTFDLDDKSCLVCCVTDFFSSIVFLLQIQKEAFIDAK